MFSMGHFKKGEEGCLKKKKTLRNLLRDHYNRLRECRQRPDLRNEYPGKSEWEELLSRKNQEDLANV